MLDNEHQPQDGGQTETDELLRSPSEDWQTFSNSDLSERHITDKERETIRTSAELLTFANLSKNFIGISALVVAKFIADAGIATAVVGAVITGVLNMYTMWLLVKARNRFKHDTITTLGDLGTKLFGESVGVGISIIQILCSFVFLLAYQKYIGEQMDQLLCQSVEVMTCGKQGLHAFVLTTLLMPFLLMRRLKSIAFVNSVIMVLTVISMSIVIYYSF